MGRGRKPTRGGRRQFTDVETLQQQSRELNSSRRNKGDGESDDEDGDGDNAAGASHTVNRQGAVGELPPSESDSDDSGEDKASKQKSGASNDPKPNTMQQRGKKINELTLESVDINDERRGLNRKERELLEKQEAKKRYQALTAAGKTDEARSDLARLAIIRKEREEAAKRREAEKKAKEDAAKARLDARAQAQKKL